MAPNSNEFSCHEISPEVRLPHLRRPTPSHYFHFSLNVEGVPPGVLRSVTRPCLRAGFLPRHYLSHPPLVYQSRTVSLTSTLPSVTLLRSIQYPLPIPVPRLNRRLVFRGPWDGPQSSDPVATLRFTIRYKVTVSSSSAKIDNRDLHSRP